MKIKCSFCGAELDTKDDVPYTVKTAIGTLYTCHRVICHNKDKHPDKNNVIMIFKPKEE